MVARVQSREILISQLHEVFQRRGYEGATLAELARATGLGKASLYHHFPGGKSEMASRLIDDAVRRLGTTAFDRLSEKGNPQQRLSKFASGFNRYTRGGDVNCLLVIFAQGSAGEENAARIHSEFARWTSQLAAVFAESGAGPKRAHRLAGELLASLYGHLITSRLMGDPGYFKRSLKRLKKTIASR